MRKTAIILMCLFVLPLFAACGKTEKKAVPEVISQAEAQSALDESYNLYLKKTELYCRTYGIEYSGEKTNCGVDGYLFCVYNTEYGTDSGLLTYCLVDKVTGQIYCAGISGDDMIPIEQYA